MQYFEKINNISTRYIFVIAFHTILLSEISVTTNLTNICPGIYAGSFTPVGRHGDSSRNTPKKRNINSDKISLVCTGTQLHP